MIEILSDYVLNQNLCVGKNSEFNIHPNIKFKKLIQTISI